MSLFQSPKYNLAISFIAGLLMVLSYAPFSLWPVAWLCLLIFIRQIHTATGNQAWWRGFSFGLGWFAAGISWVHVSIEQFGGMPLVASLLLMLLLCAYLAIFPGLAARITVGFRNLSLFNNHYLLLLPLIWFATEFLRARLLTGFPWLSLGYSQIDSPFISLVPVVGETLLSSLLLLGCVALFYLIVGQKRILNASLLAGLIIATLLATIPTWVTVSDKPVAIAMVQGNIEQSLRWDKDREDIIIKQYIADTKELYQNHDIIIWPEAAIPRVEPLAQPYLQQVDALAGEHNAALITGIISFEVDTRSFFNSLIVLGNKNGDSGQGDYYFRNANRYNKHHLLPIGEFVPFQAVMKKIAPLFDLPMSSFQRGDYVQTNLVADGFNIAPLICFEVAFAQQTAANVDNSTDLLLTVSNDAWFGDSHGPHQHLDIARMRAIEFGRPMLRATNNGITAVIDHNGDIAASIPQFVQTTLSTDVFLTQGETPFSQWGYLIERILVSLIFAFLLITVFFTKLRDRLNRA
ncbi:apolipoprotein N-acyltransferase [Thalassotalea sp. PS06]|uniref:apolipoprotein N-acyltransferase n=1 Tax=Thalassotalea sp. PS06 TaxID=2594005 RepID=UPI0011642F09|nr:apolipoprotein N-acyltransferase [Thalassotalea sp. PS06]QDP01899.1 apolipoprotein N-acyltransferase [Thalassotalea sp. PS06]